MSHWIFIATARRGYSARSVYTRRMEDAFWGLGERTPNRRSLQQGDSVVYYVGYPERVFAGTATLATPSFKLSPEERRKFSGGDEVFDTEYGVRLADIEIWENPPLVPDLLDRLSFIENTQNWGSYFQGGVRGITEDDYAAIIATARAAGHTPAAISEGGEAEGSRFALEAHLEEFIFANWERIDWGTSLRLYQTDESDGRQFPAGTWSIDFLAVDNDNGDLVVIELKRGRTGDATVGQVLRYMGWVKANVAEPGQGVRGIIVCPEVDDSLRYAVSETRNVAVLTYKVDFHLKREHVEAR